MNEVMFLFLMLKNNIHVFSSLAVTSKDTPIHLYDAFTGELRCSYRAYNHVVSAGELL